MLRWRHKTLWITFTYFTQCRYCTNSTWTSSLWHLTLMQSAVELSMSCDVTLNSSILSTLDHNKMLGSVYIMTAQMASGPTSVHLFWIRGCLGRGNTNVSIENWDHSPSLCVQHWPASPYESSWTVNLELCSFPVWHPFGHLSTHGHWPPSLQRTAWALGCVVKPLFVQGHEKNAVILGT